MRVCLASLHSRSSGFLKGELDINECKYALESFYVINDNFMKLVNNCELFLLDSGAFTFMNNKKKTKISFDDYLEEYIKFINKHNIKHFFELDIDSVVGLEKVEKLRKRLETATNKKCIPVWHKSRGKDYFIEMCKNYEYVSIGGLVTKEIPPNDYKYFNWFIDTAHDYNCQIHALGFTNTNLLAKYKFDSVDSTSWLSGGRFGHIYLFDGKNINQYNGDKQTDRSIAYNEYDKHNYKEWIKFQKYAEVHL